MIIRSFTSLIDQGDFSQSQEFQDLKNQIVDGISSVCWPEGTDRFILYPEKHGSGVKPIKAAFVRHLENHGWDTETEVDVTTLTRPGPIDLTTIVRNRLFAVEWETGNVSSSHRALNKMAMGIHRGIFIGGILIVPTRTTAYYLTDRIGNYEELEPYFPLWRSIKCDEGFLGIISIQHHATDTQVPRIPKGTDGRSQV